MKAIFALFCAFALCCGSMAAAQTYEYQANIAAQIDGDFANVTGTTRVRFVGNTLYYESSLANAVNITMVHIHLAATPGSAISGPLVMTLTSTTISNGITPLSSPPGAPLVQIASLDNYNLLAPMVLRDARAKLIELGITDNQLQTISDVRRLMAQGVLTSDVHSTARVAPFRVGSGIFQAIPPATAPASAGRRLSML